MYYLKQHIVSCHKINITPTQQPFRAQLSFAFDCRLLLMLHGRYNDLKKLKLKDAQGCALADRQVCDKCT